MAAGIRSWWTRWAWGLATLCVLLPRADAVAQNVIQARDLTDEHVRKAIDALVDELYRQRHPTRFWDPTNQSLDPKSIGYGAMLPQKPGWTALTVLALLHAGESYQEPRLRSALEYLQKTELKGTYAVAVRTLVWAMLPDQFRGELQADADHLMNGFLAEVDVHENVDGKPMPRPESAFTKLLRVPHVVVYEHLPSGYLQRGDWCLRQVVQLHTCYSGLPARGGVRAPRRYVLARLDRRVSSTSSPSRQFAV